AEDGRGGTTGAYLRFCARSPPPAASQLALHQVGGLRLLVGVGWPPEPRRLDAVGVLPSTPTSSCAAVSIPRPSPLRRLAAHRAGGEHPPDLADRRTCGPEHHAEGVLPPPCRRVSRGRRSLRPARIARAARRVLRDLRGPLQDLGAAGRVV